MDIEGSETEVLAEAGEGLRNVHYLACEYHHGSGLDKGNLAKILLLLETMGFDAHISKSWSYTHKFHKSRAMDFVEEPYSAIIWAKNRHWKWQS
jgi:hypothetical protein